MPRKAIANIALFICGVLYPYLAGKGVSADAPKALDLFVQSAEAGIQYEAIAFEDGLTFDQLMMQTVQSALKELGYACEPTGELDDATKTAVRKLRADNRLKESDEMDEELVKKILEVSAKRQLRAPALRATSSRASAGTSHRRRARARPEA